MNLDFRPAPIKAQLTLANSASMPLNNTFNSILEETQSSYSAHLDESLEVGGRDEQVRQDGQLAVPLPVLQVQTDALLGRVQRVEALLVDQVAGQPRQTVGRPAAGSGQTTQAKPY